MKLVGPHDVSRSPFHTVRFFAQWRCHGILMICLAMLAGSLTGCRTASEQPCTSPAEVDEVATSVSADPETPAPTPSQPAEEVPSEETLDFKPGKEVSFFNEKNLGLWKVTDFGGQGDVYVKDGAIYLEMGSYTTGITWSGPVVRMNYEISLEAMRVDGSDFFCALTFPVAENPCTLVLGGWGGTLCGLSNVGFYDASENETTTFYSFKNKVWYHVRLRVLPDRIQAWLDGEQLVDLDTTGKKIDIRPEMDLCQPLGIATWVTTGAVRNIYVTQLPETID